MLMPRILIAEDEPDIRNLITFTLRFSGYEVIDTSNGADATRVAMELAEKGELPDLILLDVRMPRMTGYEACQQIKAHPTLKDVPVVFLSAKGQDAEVQSGLDAGAIAYIIKPFGTEQLIAKVKELLGS
jgi:two-component system alkaline phosphatase synthesis response regulator PhoP